jgi:hypothetical protein
VAVRDWQAGGNRYTNGFSRFVTAEIYQQIFKRKQIRSASSFFDGAAYVTFLAKQEKYITAPS